MEGFVELLILKTCAAALLALGACVAGRWAERPALVHALWVVVLLELLVPPLLEVGVVPRWISAEIGVPSSQSLVSGVHGPTGVLQPADSRTVGLPLLLGGLWLGGALVVLLLAGVRIRRFARLLRGTTAPAVELRSAAERLASRLGLTRCPRIRIARAVISPMLRPRWGSLEILFPAGLLERLEPGERDALLAHELAHVRRRDHWVRWLELAAGALFWWHPLVWWARRRLRRIEERCCDGLVLDTLPAHATQYARGLVKTVEFLAGARGGLPSLASGIGAANDLEERLKMIVKHRLPKTFSRWQRTATAVAAGALLLVLPSWADRTPEEADELQRHEAELAAAEAEARARLLELEQETRLLESELQRVRERQHDLELDLMRRREELEARRLEMSGAKDAAAERLRHREEQRRERNALESDRMRTESLLMQERQGLEDPLREALLEAEAAAQRGDDASAARLEARAAEMKARLEELYVRQQAQQEADSRIIASHRRDALRALEHEIEALELRLERAETAGRRDEAAELSSHIERLRRAIEDLEPSD